MTDHRRTLGQSGPSGVSVETRVIPLHEPEFSGNEWTYLKACLDSGWVSSAGPLVAQFERAVANYVGAKFAVATVNGTTALHVALRVAGVGPDDEVLAPTLTFVSPINAIRYCGAYPVLMDVDPGSWGMDPTKVADFVAKECVWRSGSLRNRTTGRRIAAILPVHILGHPVDMDPVLDLARTYELSVVEDAAESLGARYRGRSIGSLGPLTCLSFNGNKVVTTGGGGMIVTDREDLARRARHLTTQARSDADEYLHDEVGFNYRMPNLNAALGLAQMERITSLLEAKRRLAARYREAFSGLEAVETMPEAPWASSTHWLFTILVACEPASRFRRVLLRDLRERRIEARSLWVPMHRLDPYREAQTYRIEYADRLYATAVSLPSSPGLAEAAQGRIVAVVIDTTSAWNGG